MIMKNKYKNKERKNKTKKEIKKNHKTLLALAGLFNFQ